MMSQIEIGQVYFLDGESPVKVLKAINRSKTMFSVEKENGTIETVEVERLSARDVDSHSMPDVYNNNSDELMDAE
jgi:hypothetical protein